MPPVAVLQRTAIAVVPIKRDWLVINIRSNENPVKMNNINRDLLVMFNQELMSPKAIEHQVEMLHELLFDVERTENIAAVHEVIDLNNYKIYIKHPSVKSTIKEQELKPFVFLNCRN